MSSRSLEALSPVSCCFIVLCCAFGLVQGTAAQTRRALLIGIDTYQPKVQRARPRAATKDDSRGASRWDLPVWPNLEGAVNDVKAMRDLLASTKFGFAESNIHVLLQEQAKHDAILSAMQKYLVDEPQRGDVVVFYYAGHGSQRVNTRNGKPDHLDETIVPEDANSAVFDLRNKEIARIFSKAVDKGVILTAIFDSCHSGGVARGIPVGSPGKTRFLPYDPRDAADPPDRDMNENLIPRPEDRPGGALVLSAAQEDQLAGEWDSADGTPHGAFTVALMDSLRLMPASAPAEDIYKRVKVLMQGMGLNSQQPALDGPADRRQAGLFGNVRGSGKLTVAVRPEGVKQDGSLELDGGLDLGLSAGCELKRVKLEPGDPDVRIRVENSQIGRSQAVLILPAAVKQVQPGDLFQLDKWVTPEASRLQVWLPPDLASTEIAQAVTELSKLRDSAKIDWVEDPVENSPEYLLQWNGNAWTLERAGGESQDLGKQPTVGEVLARLGAAGSKPRLFLYLPPPKDIAAQLRSQLGSDESSVEVLRHPETAQYLLVGRTGANGVRYAWVQKNISRDAGGLHWSSSENHTLCSSDSPYPPRTDWFAASSSASLSGSLVDYANRLARVRAWLQLPAPPSGSASAFPYRLALQRMSPKAGAKSEGAILTSGPVVDGESYGLVLQKAGDVLDSFRSRWVYVLGISCDGSGQLLYPLPGQEKREPQQLQDGTWPAKVDLTGETEKIVIGQPFGLDTYVLLTTADQLPDPSVLNFQGVLSRGVERGSSRGLSSPLARLLENASSGTRGMRAGNVPTDWSVEYLPIQSAPKSDSAPTQP
jgi:hypothetical protein